MLRKSFVLVLILVLLFCSACAGATVSSEQAPVITTKQAPVSTTEQASSPTPVIMELYDDPYVLAVDLPRLINNSDTIVIATVAETLPAERRGNYVYTPANIKVIESLKGDYLTGDILRIDQLGGIAGGIDFRPQTMYIHKDGDTYFFFLSGSTILDSEYVSNGQTIKGYFLEGKTIDEAASIIEDHIKNWKSNFIKQVESFDFYQDTNEGDLVYTLDKNTLEAQVSRYFGLSPNITEKWDIRKWDSFMSKLSNSGVLDWKKKYGNLSDTEGAWWSVDIGYFTCEGMNAYPDGWESFKKIIDEYFGMFKTSDLPQITPDCSLY